MLSFKKRFVVGMALLMILIATVIPAAAQDTSTSSTPDGTGVVSLQFGGLGGVVVTLSIPIRCGNNC